MAQPPTFAHYSTSPIYNTKAVARETSVPPDTFRAWERRYGVPRPQRTPGGHRLYSERDIAVIRWLRDRTEEGMNISHAVMLLTSALDEQVTALVTDEARGIERIAEDLVSALTVFDAQQAEALLSEAFALYPFERVLLEGIQPAMIEVGERWHRNEINVAAEHFATEFIRRKLAGLLNVFENNAQRDTIVVACAPTELHDIGLLFASLFLVRRGWHVVYLGPQVPLPDLLETLRTVKPSLVCLSATTFETALELLEVARAIEAEFPTLRFGYGGRVFNINPELCAEMPGMFLGEDARTLTETVGTLMARGSTSSNN
ncbi:MAG TPA: B12-binding domain-containing protein [Roseiflexaceae bacterium]|nr:B12-binding domain-containing protein [Roseiflexaceae bacterium]HMP41051.1 B12-binding domain-containing protein [Roseiflexaceae bacterium]